MPATKEWSFDPSMLRRASARPPGPVRLFVVTTAKRRAESRRAASGNASARGTPNATVCWVDGSAQPQSRPSLIGVHSRADVHESQRPLPKVFCFDDDDDHMS